MASNHRKKIFIGGILSSTSKETLRKHFENYGKVLQAVIKRDPSGRTREFGFVVFSDPSVADRVLQDKHTIVGRTVDVQRSLSRKKQLISSRSGNLNAGRSFGAGGSMETPIFVTWLPSTLTVESLCQYFEVYGRVTDVVIMYVRSTERSIGFISSDSEDAVDRVLLQIIHKLNDHFVEVQRVLQKDVNPGGGGSLMGGGIYQGYGASSANTSTYEGVTDSDSYMEPQTTGGGFPAYGFSGYDTPGYGYGVTNSGVGYGSSSAGAYGVTNSGVVAATTGQSPIGVSNYRNQGYGYESYGGSGGSYTIRGGYGSIASNSNAGFSGIYETAQASGHPDGQVGYGSAQSRQAHQQ